jgi:hypothetical protein
MANGYRLSLHPATAKIHLIKKETEWNAIIYCDNHCASDMPSMMNDPTSIPYAITTPSRIAARMLYHTKSWPSQITPALINLIPDETALVGRQTTFCPSHFSAFHPKATKYTTDPQNICIKTQYWKPHQVSLSQTDDSKDEEITYIHFVWGTMMFGWRFHTLSAGLWRVLSIAYNMKVLNWLPCCTVIQSAIVFKKSIWKDKLTPDCEWHQLFSGQSDGAHRGD